MIVNLNKIIFETRNFQSVPKHPKGIIVKTWIGKVYKKNNNVLWLI